MNFKLVKKIFEIKEIEKEGKSASICHHDEMKKAGYISLMNY